jgi:hypothetical protein
MTQSICDIIQVLIKVGFNQPNQIRNASFSLGGVKTMKNTPLVILDK